MNEKRNKNELVVRNEQSGALEVIDMMTGELVESSLKPSDESVYKFNYPMALLIVQEVRQGKTFLQIANMDGMPPLEIISHWKRTERMFQEELKLARRERSEYYHDKVVELADNAGNLEYSKDEIGGVKLAVEQYKWAAERGDPERYGNKVTHEGSESKPIIMRVVNTGISRSKPDIVIPKEESIHVEEQPENKESENENTGPGNRGLSLGTSGRSGGRPKESTRPEDGRTSEKERSDVGESDG